MANRKLKRKPPIPSKFDVGDQVRVRHGVTDADYPDIPIGGWVGAISRIQKDGVYMVRWSRETLDAIHPVFENRCANVGVELERHWLAEDDLESDEGGPLEIEFPAQVVTEPALHEDRDNRIRSVFGLDSSDRLPNVDLEMLELYHEYLVESLSFPFEAEHTPESGRLFQHSRIVKVIGLGDSDDEPVLDQMRGILCRLRHQRRVLIAPLGELEVEKGKPNRQLLKDYCCWLTSRCQ